MGVWPSRWSQASPITGIRLPTWSESAVGSKPAYAVMGPARSRSASPGVASCTKPRPASSSRRSVIGANRTRWKGASQPASLSVWPAGSVPDFRFPPVPAAISWLEPWPCWRSVLPSSSRHTPGHARATVARPSASSAVTIRTRPPRSMPPMGGSSPIWASSAARSYRFGRCRPTSWRRSSPPKTSGSTSITASIGCAWPAPSRTTSSSSGWPKGSRPSPCSSPGISGPRTSAAATSRSSASCARPRSRGKSKPSTPRTRFSSCISTRSTWATARTESRPPRNGTSANRFAT